jgi:hypothetical protein
MQQMLTKVIPVTTSITEENQLFDKLSPSRYVKNLFQGDYTSQGGQSAIKRPGDEFRPGRWSVSNQESEEERVE